MRLLSRKLLLRKALLLSSVIAVLFSCVLFFNNFIDRIYSFKIAHLATYYEAFKINFDKIDSKTQVAQLSGYKQIEGSKEISEQSFSESIPVLVYHGIVNKTNDNENITYERFNEQMKAISEDGFITISQEEFISFIKEKKVLPKKSIMLTFDDGRKDSYYPVDPILNSLGFKATMFVISNRFKSKFHLSQSELKSMQKSGRWDIESHGHADHDLIQIDEKGTKGYFLTNKMWLVEKNRLETDEEFKTRISDDLSFAKDNLSKIFKKEITSFAFPFGDYGQRSKNYPEAENVIKEVVANDYPFVYYQVWEGQNDVFNHPNPNATTTFIKRIKPTQDWTGEYLVNFLDRAAAKELPLNDDFSKDIGWKKLWGNVSIENNKLSLNSVATSTSAGVILDGTHHFQDYKLSAEIESSEAKTVTVFGRYLDADNYVSCIYSEDSIKLEEKLNGVKRNAFYSKLRTSPLDGVAIGTESNKNTFGCTLDGELVAYTEYIDPKLYKGAIGFYVWNSEKDAKLVINNVNIKK